jgi:hypothetical protein
MRVASLDGRLALVREGIAVDVELASQGWSDRTLRRSTTDGPASAHGLRASTATRHGPHLLHQRERGSNRPCVRSALLGVSADGEAVACDAAGAWQRHLHPARGPAPGRPGLAKRFLAPGDELVSYVENIGVRRRQLTD